MAERALRRRKREDSAVAVPALGVVLLLSPILNIFAGPTELFGIPLAFVWIFAVWAGLILITRALARRLMPHPDASAPKDT